VLAAACSSARPVSESPAVENHAGSAVAVPIGLDIMFTRTECMGTCPVYAVAIHHDGRVDWEGRRYVRVVGRGHKQLERTGLDQLAVAIDGARFFEREHDGRLPPPPCDDHNGTTICLRGFSTCSDTSHFTISVTRDGKTHEVDDAGCYREELEDLRRLERVLEQVAGTATWVGH
jgi:hypothetical protein